jgi:hypothetical protein
VLERPLRELDRDGDSLTGIGIDHGEACQPLRRALDRRLRLGRVHLDDLATAAGAGVLHRDLHLGRRQRRR